MNVADVNHFKSIFVQFSNHQIITTTVMQVTYKTSLPIDRKAIVSINLFGWAVIWNRKVFVRNCSKLLAG